MLDALVPLDSAMPGALVPIEAEKASARRYAQAGKAPSTVEGYRRDFAAFARWCAARGLASMPATTDTVILHITSIADGGLSVSSVGRRLASITYAHKLGREANPCTGDDLREVLAGVRRTLGTAPKRKAAATADRVRAMLDECDTGTMLGLRDRAILALGFAGAFRRSELVALTVADLTEVPDGYRVMIDVARCVKRYAKAAGLDPAEFSGHSLRAGFVTSAAETGASILKIQEVSRHKSVDVLRGYVRSADLFKEHAGAAFL